MTTLTLDAAVPFETFENAGLLYYYGDLSENGYLLTSSRSDAIKFIGWDEAWADNHGVHDSGRGALANPAFETVTLTRDDGLALAWSSRPWPMPTAPPAASPTP